MNLNLIHFKEWALLRLSFPLFWNSIFFYETMVTVVGVEFSGNQSSKFTWHFSW